MGKCIIESINNLDLLQSNIYNAKCNDSAISVGSILSKNITDECISVTSLSKLSNTYAAATQGTFISSIQKNTKVVIIKGQLNTLTNSYAAKISFHVGNTQIGSTITGPTALNTWTSFSLIGFIDNLDQDANLEVKFYSNNSNTVKSTYQIQELICLV